MAKITPLSIKNFYDKLQFFPEYWKGLKPLNDVDSTSEKDWLVRVQMLDKLSAQNSVAIFLWNAFSNQFIYMSDSLRVFGGYDPERYTQKDGVDYSVSLIHPTHLKGVLQLYEMALSYGQKNHLTPLDKVVLSLNYLYKDNTGKYLQTLQQCIVVEADLNLQPRLVLSFVHNISHIKKEQSIGLVISSPMTTKIFYYDLTTDKIIERKPFSTQELRVLRYLGQGLDTKQIATLLNISPNTVDTHRRNLINKTDCLDTTAVVSYAKLINIV
ncbi:MAG TPA: LuxR C-terminal-related transcriptional regulator [Mucilaginibacter sp.]|jgi:DNA-binding CsgD family transcriptional regulator|nr:LuxR C-terminal-related transcriptional regulator [Mucilaginibacter sp.]